MSEAEAEARRANRWTWACLSLVLGCAILAGLVSSAFLILCVVGLVASWACGVWCVKAKGYSMWLALLGPLTAVSLPSLHPVLEQLRRYEATCSPREREPNTQRRE